MYETLQVVSPKMAIFEYVMETTFCCWIWPWSLDFLYANQLMSQVLLINNLSRFTASIGFKIGIRENTMSKNV